jgi:hypothetical protein
MSARQAWAGQPYLDELRPERGASVRLALFATYSVDVSAIAAMLLALIGRNDDRGSGTIVDFAEAIEGLRGKVQVLIQRGRIARPVALPKIAGILDQFVVEQPHDEKVRSWHPKIALVAYTGPGQRAVWKLWIGSRNLTRSVDLDAGVIIQGVAARGKGRVRLPGIGAVARTLAADSNRADSDAIGTELEGLWWEAPKGYTLRAVLNGLENGFGLPASPPPGEIEGVTIISPFLSEDFLRRAGGWGPDGARTLVSSVPAIAAIAARSASALTGFSKILAYAAPDPLPADPPAGGSQSTRADGQEASDDDDEPAPTALHAKIYSFDMGGSHIIRLGSANATGRAWSGRNSEIMLELSGGEEYGRGLDFLVRSAIPVTPADLIDAGPMETNGVDALEESRRALVAAGTPVLMRDGEMFTLDMGQEPRLAYPQHRLEAGHANGDRVAWPAGERTLALGRIPLAYQSAFIQLRIHDADGDISWMQRVEVRPEMEPGRDVAALSSHMGLRAFHDWMRAILAGDALPPGGAAWDEEAGTAPASRKSRGDDRLTLEDILLAWAKDRRAFSRADRHFTAYLDAILTHGQDLTFADRRNLNELSQIWTMVRGRLAP